ncbi:hypothetical protein PHLCEN_2v12554 [Hermanssonia centrifuga]|uniref:Uncharacterized protein n=1 Tax=Hermanssonia centrifuga TaxID=98765 RepID=A0A2R6NGX7_9APHY|nr:hypothetical protein PHLCEN_2v12554 [Hermanssonia centrifuga]
MARRARHTQAARQASEEAREAARQEFLQQDKHMIWRQWYAELEELNRQAEERIRLQREHCLAQLPVVVDLTFTVLRSGRKVPKLRH